MLLQWSLKLVTYYNLKKKKNTFLEFLITINALYIFM